MMNANEFLATLAAPLTLHGENRSTLEEVYARIRQEIKLAQAAGIIPAGTKISVRSPHHKSLRVEVVAWSGAVFSDEYTAHLLAPEEYAAPHYRNERLAPELAATIKLLETLTNRHNFDESRSEEDYFHVGYYDSVDARTVENIALAGIEAERNPAAAEFVRRATVAASKLSKNVIKSVLGRRGLAGVGEYDVATLEKLAARAEAKGAPLEYSKSRMGWF